MDLKFTEIIVKKLADKNLSAVSREIGIPKAVLHDWVKGRRLPSLKNIQYVKKLADYLGLTLDEILIGRKGKDFKVISSVQFHDDKRKYEIVIKRLD